MKSLKTVKQVSEMASISIRTLHYYDEIGLLKPDEWSDKGYRLYTEENLMTLQQILFFKEIGIELREIKSVMNQPNFNREEALIKQRQILLLKQKRLQEMIELIDENLEGKENYNMEVFSMEEIRKIQEQYKEEVETRWGKSDAYKQCQQKTKQYGKKEWEKVKQDGEEIFKEIALYRNRPISDEKVQALIAKWQNHITKSFYDCSDEILLSLGQMYVADERFTKNIDQFGEGLASFISEAIKYYCQSK